MASWITESTIYVTFLTLFGPQIIQKNSKINSKSQKHYIRKVSDTFCSQIETQKSQKALYFSMWKIILIHKIIKSTIYVTFLTLFAPKMSPRRPNKESSYCSALCTRVHTRRPKTADETSPKLHQHHQKHYIRNVSDTIWPQNETPTSQKNTACVTFRTLFCSPNNRKHYIRNVSDTFCFQNEIP